MKNAKRCISWLLCLAMLIGFLPVAVLQTRVGAIDGTTPESLPADALPAIWSAPVTVDNILNEEAWNFLCKAIPASENGAPSGVLQARWDKDGLTLGMTSPDAASISASVNGKDAKSVTGTTAEIHYTWAGTGITLTDYNLPVPVKVTLTGASGSTVRDVVANKGEGGGSAIFAAIYLPEENSNLYIKLLGIDPTTQAPADLANIDLGRKLGEKFQLDILWNKDGAVTVYVDGAEKHHAANGTNAFSNGMAAKSTRYQFIAGSGKTCNAEISGSTISYVGTGEETVLDAIRANWKPLAQYAGIAQAGNVTVPADILAGTGDHAPVWILTALMLLTAAALTVTVASKKKFF